MEILLSHVNKKMCCCEVTDIVNTSDQRAGIKHSPQYLDSSESTQRTLLL